MKHEEVNEFWDVIQQFKEGKKIQFYCTVRDVWRDTDDPTFNKNFSYRVKPAEPDYVPWDAIHPKFKWYARDKNGSTWLFEEKPTCLKLDYVWNSDKCYYEEITNDAKRIFAFNINCELEWKDSLQERPNNV